MSYKIDTSRSPLHYLKHLMGLNINEIDKLFTPLFDKRIENTETSEFLDTLDDEISGLMFGMDKSELSEQGLLSFNSSILSNYLLCVKLGHTENQHIKNLKQNTSSLKSAVVIIENLLQHQNDSIDNENSITKAYFSLKEEIKTLENEQIARTTKHSDGGKQSNPTPPNTTKYFFECVNSVLALDTEKQLYTKDVTKLARNQLLDKVGDFEIEWKNNKAFGEDWFNKKLKEDFLNLPEYLSSNNGKKQNLREATIKKVESELGI